MRLGVLIPCRNEAAVIERKLANLARVEWPGGAHGQRIVVVDDGSEDGTAELARAAAARLFTEVDVRVIENRVRPGKPGALRAGLELLRGECELVVLTDADVVLEDGALVELAAAFEREPVLALACGAQCFVAQLAPDGSFPALERDASDAWDRWTDRVRELESRAGRLFSVHGQLLAWRAELGLVPSFGIAADDLDLMLQVRSRTAAPRRVRRIAQARFAEVKTPEGPHKSEQQLRRARAYLQVLRANRAARGGAVDALQGFFYRHLPMALAAATWTLIVLTAGLALLCAPVRRWLALVRVIARAQALERESTLAERWEMARS